MTVEVPLTAPWMQHLERAHGLTHEAARAIAEEPEPSLHLAPAARQLERAVVAMYDAFDGRADRATSVSLAHSRVWDAAVLVARAGLSAPLAALREACGELVSAEERLPRGPAAPRVPLPLRAAAELPPLHSIERASMGPVFRAPPIAERSSEPEVPVLPEPSTFEELAAAAVAVRALVSARRESTLQQAATKPRRAAPMALPEEVPEGFAFAPPAVLDEGTFVRRWARECIEEIGMLGIQRAPLAGDDWRSCQALERRLVASMDALAALGPTALASVEPFVMDAPAADPLRIFAAAMIGGCMEGRDALAAAERALHRFGAGDRPVAQAFVAAMKLVPNPFVPQVARGLFSSTDRACRAIGLELMVYRDWLTEADMDTLADEEDMGLLALALPALAKARSKGSGPALARALACTDLAVQEAALDAMALSAHPDAASAACAAARGPLGDRALVRLALVADDDDARWLLDRATSISSPLALAALGWAGSVGAVPLLLGSLESEDDEVKLAAGAALDRLLGANLVDLIEVLPEAIDDTSVTDPDPDAAPPRRPMVELAGDPRDKPPQGSAEKLEVPSIDPARWRAYWEEHGRSLDAKKRHRRGQPYSPSVSLFELDQLPLSADDRRRLHRELAARTGKVTPFDPHDFVVVQEQSLRAWESIVRATEGVLGSYGRPIAR